MEYPHLQALYTEFKDRGFTVLSIETSNRPQLAKEFTDQVGATFPIVLDDSDVSGKLFDVHATPTNLVIDSRGQILFRNLGYSPGKEKTLAAEIEYALGQSEALGMRVQ